MHICWPQRPPCWSREPRQPQRITHPHPCSQGNNNTRCVITKTPSDDFAIEKSWPSHKSAHARHIYVDHEIISTLIIEISKPFTTTSYAFTLESKFQRHIKSNNSLKEYANTRLHNFLSTGAPSALPTRGGVTKAPFVDVSVSKIFDLANVPVIFLESHSYLTGATAAQLRRHLSITNVIFIA